jgi:hypothetical protein
MNQTIEEQEARFAVFEASTNQRLNAMEAMETNEYIWFFQKS